MRSNRIEINILLLSVDEEYTKIMFSLENGIRLAIVPAEEELSHDNHKLPRINPFRLSKLTRI